jgi:hypothetical protein
VKHAAAALPAARPLDQGDGSAGLSSLFKVLNDEAPVQAGRFSIA